MFSCRMCSENPFVSMFQDEKPESKRKKAASVPAKKSSSKSPGRSVPAKNSSSRSSRRNDTTFHGRTDEEVAFSVREWDFYVHPRAREFFTDPDMLEEVLIQLAKGINNDDDPVLGPEDKCVFWYGDVTKDDLQAAIRMVKPGEKAASVTYVNRVLAFIFATDDSFEQLMKLPKEPFKMSCGDQLCVHLAHIALAT